LRGEEVLIAQDKTPVVRSTPTNREGFRLGMLDGICGDEIPDFIEPMSDDDLASWEGRGSP